MWLDEGWTLWGAVLMKLGGGWMKVRHGWMFLNLFGWRLDVVGWRLYVLAQQVDVLWDGSILVHDGVHHLDGIFQTQSGGFVELQGWAAGASLDVLHWRCWRLSLRLSGLISAGGAHLRLCRQHPTTVQLHFNDFHVPEETSSRWLEPNHQLLRMFTVSLHRMNPTCFRPVTNSQNPQEGAGRSRASM